jgi:hypothetical protein
MEINANEERSRARTGTRSMKGKYDQEGLLTKRLLNQCLKKWPQSVRKGLPAGGTATVTMPDAGRLNTPEVEKVTLGQVRLRFQLLGR